MTLEIDHTLRILFDAVCNENISPEQQAELNVRLSQDPLARQMFLDYVQLHLTLDFLHRGERASQRAFKNLGLASASVVETSAPRSPLLGFLNRLPQSIQPAEHPIRFLAAATTLTAIFWTAIVFLIWRPLKADLEGIPTPEANLVLAIIESTHKAIWDEGQQALPPGATLHQFDRIELKSGQVRLHFLGGAFVAIDGPASLRIESKAAMTLEAGKILAQVSGPARRFQVNTQDVLLTDLGTEFGVTVQPNSTELDVFKGLVEARSPNPKVGQIRQFAAGSAALFKLSPQPGFLVKEKKMNRTVYLALATILALPSAATRVQATPIAVPNFSFENPVLTDNAFTSTSVNGDTTAVPGWRYDVVVAGTGTAALGGIYNPVNSVFAGTTGASSPMPTPAVGPQGAFINLNSATSGQTSRLTTNSSLATIQGNSTYSLAIAMGDRLDTVAGNLEIALLANGTPIPGAVTTIAGNSIPNGTFVDMTASFTTAYSGDPLVGQALTIRFTHSRAAGSATISAMVMDNVRLSVTELPPPAPEPTSASLMIIGCGGLALVARTRMRRKTV